jgi:hypothetical protein
VLIEEHWRSCCFRVVYLRPVWLFLDIDFVIHYL